MSCDVINYKKELTMRITVKQKQMTKAVIEKIIEIDKTFYSDFDYNDTAWYFNRYSEKNSITVLEANGEIVGYYLFYSISQRLYKEICQLQHDNDYNFDEREVNVASEIEYIPSVLVQKEYLRYAYKLIMKLRKDIASKKRLVAIAISPEGHRMCEKFLEWVGCVRPGVDVYEKDVNK